MPLLEGPVPDSHMRFPLKDRKKCSAQIYISLSFTMNENHVQNIRQEDSTEIGWNLNCTWFPLETARFGCELCEIPLYDKYCIFTVAQEEELDIQNR